MILTTAQLDRAVGALLGTAVGDALGAPYEFAPPRGPELEVVMTGGRQWEPGEWTDDTAMAIAIAEVASTGADLRDELALDAVVRGWHEWAQTAKDIGIQTSQVLQAADWAGLSASSAREAAAALHDRTGRTAGNGSLMRTAPVALAYLGGSRAPLVEAARAISELTHFDDDAGDACVLWTLAIRDAVLTGILGIRAGIELLPVERRTMWVDLIDEAENARPSDFPNNGWVVTAFQAAWSAIATTTVPEDDPASGVFRVDHLRLALDAAVRAGNDTDTVAAIAGGLLGAVYGASAVPVEWRRLLHGWPNYRTRDLVRLASSVALKRAPDSIDYSYIASTPAAAVQHPYDDGVWIGGVNSMKVLPPDIDAIVSLCRVDPAGLPAGVEQIDVRLIDQQGANENLDFVLLDTVRLIEALRREEKSVLLHCVQAQSRTPTIASLYGARTKKVSIERAVQDVHAALPDADPIPEMLSALRRLSPLP